MTYIFASGLSLAFSLEAGSASAVQVSESTVVTQLLEPSTYAVIVVCAIAFALGLILRIRKF